MTIDALWYTRCSVPTPFSFAAQNGWFEDEFAEDGFAVRSLRESSDPAVLGSHFDHSVANSFRQGGSVPAIWAAARGADTRVVAISWTDEYQAIIARPGSGITRLADLRGRRIGIPRHAIAIDHNRASARRAFEVALPLAGLSLADVEPVDLADADYGQSGGAIGNGPLALGRRRRSYTNEAYALVRGDVDAVYVKDVRGLELKHLLGAHELIELGFHPDPFVRISNCAPRPLTVSGALLRERPDLVDRFVARVVEAGEWATTRPDETVRLIASETGWSERSIRQALGDEVHLHMRATLDPAWIAGLGTFIDFLTKADVIDPGLDVDRWIDPGPLARVRAAHAPAPGAFEPALA